MPVRMIIGSAPVLVLVVVVVIARPPRCHFQLIQQSKSGKKKKSLGDRRIKINLLDVDVQFVLQIR